MKILLIAFAANGALGQYLQMMGRGFRKNIGSNVALAAPETFVYKDDWRDSFVLIGKKYRSVGDKIKTIISLKQIFKFYCDLRCVSPTVIQVVGGEFHPWIFVVWFYCKLNSSKLILTVHDPEPHVGSRKDKYLLYIRPVFLRLADKVHFLSESNLYERYANKKKGFLVEHGSTNELFHTPQKEQKKIYDFSLIGRLEYYKGVDLFVAALEEMSREGISFRAYIGGPGILDKALVDRICCIKGVEFKNAYLSDEEFGAILDKTKNLVLPYRHVTQSSLPLLANAFGCRVVASDLGDFRNIVAKLDGLLFVSNSHLSLVGKLKEALALESYAVKNTEEYLFEKQYWEFVKHYT